MELSLRIWHPTEDPEIISREMELPASLSYRAGDPRVTPSGRVLESIHRETLWCHDIKVPESITLDRAITVAAQLVAERRCYLESLRATGARLECFVGVFPDASWTGVLTPETLRACGDDRISLVLNVYIRS